MGSPSLTYLSSTYLSLQQRFFFTAYLGNISSPLLLRLHHAFDPPLCLMLISTSSSVTSEMSSMSVLLSIDVLASREDSPTRISWMLRVPSRGRRHWLERRFMEDS